GDNGFAPEAVAWSPDSHWIAVAGQRALPPGLPRHPNPLTAILQSPYQKESVVDCWDVHSLKRIGTFAGRRFASRLCITPDAGWIVTYTSDQVIRFLDMASRTCAAEIKGGDSPVPCRDLALSPDARWLATAHDLRHAPRVQLWELDWDLEA